MNPVSIWDFHESRFSESMTNPVASLNQLTAFAAQNEFLKCCGSTRWSRTMTEARPFTDIPSLLETSEQIWWSLANEDWLEAFRAHPKIGEQRAATAQSELAQRWSAREQAGTATAPADVKAALAEENREYENQFGFIFIVCATGKSAEEMLALLRARLKNDLETELRVAAAEQSKITRLRLEKLLCQ